MERKGHNSPTRADRHKHEDVIFKSADAELRDKWKCFAYLIPADRMAGCFAFAEKQGCSIVAAANSEGELNRYLGYIRPDKSKKPEHDFAYQSANNHYNM